jgi:hypothetical protein
MTTYWAILPERNGAANYECFNSMLDVAMNAGQNGYHRIRSGYTRVDAVRNAIIRTFLNDATDPNDLLVMMDADHKYPDDIIQAFSEHDPELGVVGALAYRRGEPYDALFFLRDETGLHSVFGDFERGDQIYQCAMISTSSISIRKWVLDKLIEKGYELPYFRYEYNTLNNGTDPSEDVYFSKICEQVGIPVYVDSGIEIPHATIKWIDHTTRLEYEKTHPMATKEIMSNCGIEIKDNADGN